jgi:N-acetylglucosaminyldiphosphoundecaprenol N-acetyl-beta-D-mannosaminyltransferase
MRIDIMGVGFDDITAEQSVLYACDIIDRGEKAYIVTPNPEIVWSARRNESLRNAIGGAGLVLPDGIGIIIGARILGTPLRNGRVTGIDFAAALFDKMAQSGGSVYLLGAKPGVAEEAGYKLAEKYPGLRISGAADGYFSDDRPIIDDVNSANPDVLLVCLGSPKQELWMAENIGQLDVKLCAGLGGSLDIFAGRAKRAPAFFRRLGLEWLYRLLREPRRIKRMLKLPLFIFAVMWKRVKK